MKKRMYIVITIVVVLPAIFLGSLVPTWVRCMTNNAPVPYLHILGMRLRGAPIRNITTQYIAATKVGIALSITDLETHAAAGGNVETVVEAMIEANRAGIPLDYVFASALELAPTRSEGGVSELVHALSEPVIVRCPPEGSSYDYLEVAAGDGVLLHLDISATVVPNLQNYAGGATKETLAARISSVTTECIGSLSNHLQALNNPAQIGRTVQQSKPDAGTAWKILALDIKIWTAGARNE